MKNNKIKTFYNKRVWLNSENSPSTGSMVAYDGLEYGDDNKVDEIRYLRFADCYNIIRLHQAYYDTEEDFINKIILIRDELNLFIKHLKNKQK